MLSYGPLLTDYFIQASTSYGRNLCFSKSSEKLPEITKLFWTKIMSKLSEISQCILDNFLENSQLITRQVTLRKAQLTKTCVKYFKQTFWYTQQI